MENENANNTDNNDSRRLGGGLKLGRRRQSRQDCLREVVQGLSRPDGAGNPAIAKMMKVDLRDLKSPDVRAMSDDDIRKIITDGKGKMRPVTAVTGEAVNNVIAYVRSLKK